MLRRRNCEVKSYVTWAFFSYHGGPRDESVAHLGLRNGRHLAPTSYLQVVDDKQKEGGVAKR